MSNYGLEKGKILSPLTNNNRLALVEETSSLPEMVIRSTKLRITHLLKVFIV